MRTRPLKGHYIGQGDLESMAHALAVLANTFWCYRWCYTWLVYGLHETLLQEGMLPQCLHLMRLDVEVRFVFHQDLVPGFLHSSRPSLPARLLRKWMRTLYNSISPCMSLTSTGCHFSICKSFCDITVKQAQEKLAQGQCTKRVWRCGT